LQFKIQLLVGKDGINYEVMDILISAVQKVVIKDIVLYAQGKELLT